MLHSAFENYTTRMRYLVSPVDALMIERRNDHLNNKVGTRYILATAEAEN